MLENNFGSSFYCKTLAVKNREGARAINLRVTVNRPRDTIPIHIRHPCKWNVQAGSKIKEKKATKELRCNFIIIVELLRDEGQ